jgi:hypothetical protein
MANAFCRYWPRRYAAQAQAGFVSSLQPLGWRALLRHLDELDVLAQHDVN